MKSLKEYINEAKLPEGVEEKIKGLEEEAAKKNLTIKFRNRKTNTGDFCIFIYSEKQRRYEVGFDGDWKDTSEFSFDNCLKDAYEWIENYKG